MPVIWLNTVKESSKNDIDNDENPDIDDDNDENRPVIEEYECPVFKTSKRTSIISSSGRSEEHILSVVRLFNYFIYIQYKQYKILILEIII